MQGEGRKYTYTMSYVEIYNEVIKDLLDGTGKRVPKIHEDVKVIPLS